MTETHYERATAGLFATVVALVAITLVLAAIVMGRLHHSVKNSPVLIEVVDLADKAPRVPISN